ncbi:MULTISPECIES: hypothetical protein [unclassified Mycolicibacterium]|uniref:hypothetical protein n=1 Tax=unclassified Mycolicibacterium TaxID=2636767 RepID=UPI002EDA09F1
MIDTIDESADGSAVIIGSDDPSGALEWLLSKTLSTWPQPAGEVQLGATMVAAAAHGLAGEPEWQRGDDEGRAHMSPDHAGALRDLQYSFRQLSATERDASQALVLRMFCAPRPTVRSRRRPLSLVHEPLHG